MSQEDERISTMSDAELDALPLGIIRLDKAGTILYYNPAEAELARRAGLTSVGLNFFRDVAPCTAVKEFQGRFNDFISSNGNRIEPFSFLFRFGWGDMRVNITMVRYSKTPGDAIYVVVNVAQVTA